MNAALLKSGHRRPAGTLAEIWKIYCMSGLIVAGSKNGMEHGTTGSIRMTRFSHVPLLALLAAGWLALCPRAGAQALAISVSNSPSPVLIGNSAAYTINVTNLLGTTIPLYVTNTFSTNAQLVSASVVYAGNPPDITSSNATSIAIQFPPLGVFGNELDTAQITVLAAPTQAGLFTNTIAVSGLGFTNFVTNVVLTAVIPPPLQADLAVTVAGPIQTVITNDWMTYDLTATNMGPDDATNVVLTNTLPPGVLLLSVSPSNQTYSVVSGSNLLFSLATFTNGAYANLAFTVQPTNVGLLTLSASLGSTNIVDPNPTNNFASTNVPVIAYLATLSAVTNSGQVLDLQNGYLEQSILLSNPSGTNQPAARLVVTGLTNFLVNAVGTNSGNPFVYLSSPLAANQAASLLLQYPQRSAFPFTNGQLQAFGVPMPNWTPPPATAVSNNFSPYRIVPLSNGRMLIEWPAVTNQSYTVVYSDNLLFSNAMIAPPTITAQVSRQQWIDYGPPTTVSAPTNSTTRFYRLILNP